MNVKFTPLPPELPNPDDPEWLNSIALCSISCAKTMESRLLRTNEFPVVLGSLIVALSDHTGEPVQTIAKMVAEAAIRLRDNTSPDIAAA